MIPTQDFLRWSHPLRHEVLGSVVTLVFLLATCANVEAAATYTDLFNFDGTHGCCPDYPQLVTQGRDGNLYGVTSGGGANGVGVVFRITSAGTYKVLYNFDTTHGATPRGGLTLGTDGNFYGTTDGGGSAGFGTIFKITPAGSLTVLHNFTGGIDGGHPDTPPVQGTDGRFYGTTYQGTTYQVTSSGGFTELGSIPGRSYSPLIQATNGFFYGTTPEGGTHGVGTVFRLTSSGVVTVIYSFDTTHGAAPYGPVVQGSDGNLYGTTNSGGTANGGVVFQLKLTGVIKVLHSFVPNVATDGNSPTAGLVLATDGNFYGVTAQGGNVDSSSGGHGVLFEVTSGGSYSILYNFDGINGSSPYATPGQHTNGMIYGLAAAGGSLSSGVVYSFDTGIPAFVKLVPILGKIGATVQILGAGFTGTTGVSFNGAAATFTVKSDTYLTATIPAGATTGFVTVTTSTGTLTSSLPFRVTPFVSGFTPTSGVSGSQVVITGSGLTGTSKVAFGGVTATTFAVNSDTQVTATVPAGAITGKIAVTTPWGSATSTTAFTVVLTTLTGFSPTSGPVGTAVVITGTGLTQTSKITFGGVAATSFTVNSDTQLTATVPIGAITGNIAATTPGGTATSAAQFSVTPVISSFGPTSGSPGTAVVIAGSGLTQTTVVTFGGVAAPSFTVNSDGQVTSTVPNSAVTGKIAIVTPGGTASSSGLFVVTGTPHWMQATSNPLTLSVNRIAVDPGSCNAAPASCYFYAGATNGGAYASSDHGSTWSNISGNALPFETVSEIAVDDVPAQRVMFAGTPDSGVFKSDLPLINWLAANGTGAGALGNSDIQSIAVDLGGNIWAGTGAGVWFTSVEDQGISTWTLASTFTTKVDSLLIMSSNTIYAGTAANTIYKTANGGATWNVVLSTASPVTALGRTSGGSSIVLAGTSDGSIYKSADSGGSWVVTQSTTAQVNQFAFDPSSATVYAASNGTGVWKSLDNGSTWINVSSGLSNLRVLGVALDLSSPSTVVAGTAGNGFFITTTGGQ